MSTSSESTTSEYRVEVSDVSLAVTESGPAGAAPLLLLTGAGNTSASWDDGLVAALAAGPHRVIRYDTRDTGRSTRFPVGNPGYGMDALVRDAAGIIDAVAGGRAHVLGLSQGGAVAQLLALDHPGKVRSLTLVATTSDGFLDGQGDDLPGPAPRVRAIMTDETPPPDFADRDATITWLAESERPYAGTAHPFDLGAQIAVATRTYDRSPDLATLFNGFMMSPPTSWRHRLAEITAPTLVVHGTDDPMFPLPHGEALAREIPSATLLAVAGMGHEYLPAWTRAEVIPAILRHLAAA